MTNKPADMGAIRPLLGAADSSVVEGAGVGWTVCEGVAVVGDVGGFVGTEVGESVNAAEEMYTEFDKVS